jgi:multidrug efflux pump subunit AcrA (membrane-fusion protein)
VLGIAAVAVAYLAISQLGTSTSSARTETEVVTAEDGVVQSTASGTGNVEAGVEDDVNFATSGTLQHVYVRTGEHVTKGEILATLDPTSAELTLSEAEITLEEAKTNLTDAEDGIATTSSSNGSSGSSGATTDSAEENVPDSTEFVSDERAVAAGTTTTTTTTTTMTKTVPGRQSPPSAHKKTTTTATSTTSATTPAANQKSSNTGSETSTTSSATVSETTIEADKLTVESDEQTVASDKLAVENTILHAPVSGTVASLEDISAGASVSSGSSSSSSSSDDSSSSSSSSSGSTSAGSLGGSSSSSSSTGSSSSSSSFAEIVNTKTLTMTVPFSESDISEIKAGQAANVTLDALTGVELGAKVTSISSLPTESDDVVSYDVTLTIDQTEAKVRPGMSASAAVIISQAHGVTVPTEAVTGSGSEATVTLDESGKHVTQQVIVGLRGSTRDEIASGVKAGQELIVTETLPSLGSSTTSSSTSSTSTGRGTFGGGTGGGFGTRAGGFAGGAGFGGGAPGGAP